MGTLPDGSTVSPKELLEAAKRNVPGAKLGIAILGFDQTDAATDVLHKMQEVLDDPCSTEKERRTASFHLRLCYASGHGCMPKEDLAREPLMFGRPDLSAQLIEIIIFACRNLYNFETRIGFAPLPFVDRGKRWAQRLTGMR